MTMTEADQAATKLAGLFPGQLTVEQRKMLLKEFRAFRQDAVLKAIHDHRVNPDLKDGFLNIGKLMEGCRAAERGQRMASKLDTAKEGTRADIIRRQWPQIAQVKDDREVYLRHHRREWHEYESRRDRYGDEYLARQMARIRERCVWHLMETGMDEATAKEWAAMVFASPDHFKLAVSQLRGDLMPTGTFG